MDDAFFDSPVFCFTFGVDAPVGEVFSVEERLGMEEGGEEDEEGWDAHSGRSTDFLELFLQGAWTV